MLTAGYGPDVRNEQHRPFAMTGKIAVVYRHEQRFLVAVDPEAEAILMQEARAEPYERAE